MKVKGFDGSRHHVCPMCGWFTDPGKPCGECGYVENGNEDVEGWGDLLDQDADEPEESFTYTVKDCGWSEYDGAPRFEVRCVETGEVVYQTDQEWKANIICERWNEEGPP